ncbi:MAG: RDD family protein [Calditrichaeota bacterium]|nr:MAG: RDD family protein [Calditrichota bacterium]
MNSTCPSHLRYASFLRRAAAFTLDALLLLPWLLPAITMMMLFHREIIELAWPPWPVWGGIGVSLISGMGFAFWNTIFRVSRTGQSLGKQWVKIAIYGEEGAPVEFKKILLRETLGRWASGLPCFMGYLAMGWDERRRAWHDRIAGTVVIQLPHRSG